VAGVPVQGGQVGDGEVAHAHGGGDRGELEQRQTDPIAGAVVFDGTELDRIAWATRYIYNDGTLDKLNDEQERYEDHRNHDLANGILSLVARPVRDGRGASYESGMIRSRRTFYYGYFETRVFLPDARGAWPAFWLNSDYDGDGRLSWPPEIDAFEFVNNGTHETPDMIHSSVTVSKTGAQDGHWMFRDSTFNPKWTYFRSPSPLNVGWQVIGLLWKPDSVSMYLNGKKLYTRAYRWVYDDGTRAGPAHVLLRADASSNQLSAPRLVIGCGWRK